MKCAICGKKTDWDTSYGRETFIVCPTCHNKIAFSIQNFRKQNSVSAQTIASMVIIKIGRIMEEEKGE